MLVKGLGTLRDFVSLLVTHSAEIGTRLPAGDVMMEALSELSRDQQKGLSVFLANMVLAYGNLTDDEIKEKGFRKARKGQRRDALFLLTHHRIRR